MAGLIDPETITNPQSVIAKVGMAIAAKQISIFLQEYADKRAKKEVEEELKSTDSFYELLKFIEQNPGEERVAAMKSIFFASVKPGSTELEQQLAFQLMQICEKISVGDIFVLKAAYEIANNKAKQGLKFTSQTSKSEWRNNVSAQIGHNLPSLVESSESNLIELKLITGDHPNSVRDYSSTEHYRLTELGYKLCEYITEGKK